ncbi:hypothetical protein DRO69_06740 [Candidatus Bathyarchaeota archaeon]|nr:MAG: hypothetical protein DRO69_06740 [Candidatus Bathyarchaeota archaeon]
MVDEKKKSIPLLVKLCSDKAAYEARPQRKVSFDLNKLQKLFKAVDNYQILVYTPYIIVLKNKRGKEVTFSEDGRMLLKNVSGESEAKALACDVFEMALKASKRRIGS